MKKHCVELHQTGQFSQFFLDYIGGKEELTPFYSHAPKLESFKEAIEQKTFSEGNRKPEVNISADKTLGAAPLTVNFSSAGTQHPDKSDQVSFLWDFGGNGATSN